MTIFFQFAIKISFFIISFVRDNIESKFVLYMVSSKLSEFSFGIFLNSYVKLFKEKLFSSIIVLVTFEILLEITFPSLSVITFLVKLHIIVFEGSILGLEQILSKELIYILSFFSSFLVSAYSLSKSNPFIEHGLILLKALKISSRKFLDNVSGHVIENIILVSVCSTIHIGKIAFLIKSLGFSSFFSRLLSFLLFKFNFSSNSQSSLSKSKVTFEQRLLTVITVVYIVV